MRKKLTAMFLNVSAKLAACVIMSAAFMMMPAPGMADPASGMADPASGMVDFVSCLTAAASRLTDPFARLTVLAAPFEPWSNVNGYWISADGKSTIKGAMERGVTISKYQNLAGDIDWGQIAGDDISFAMIRLGYEDEQDPYFDRNMKDAEKNGIKTGVCFYGRATSSDAVREEARYVLDVVKDYKVSYPIGYDITSGYLNEDISKKDRTEFVNIFCQAIEDAGYKALVFGDHDWLSASVYIDQIPYDIWYSRYGIANSFQNRTLWRCTDSGHIRGIPGNVCIEFSFEDYGKAFAGTGWRTINGETYYFHNYVMMKGVSMVIGDEYYRFDKNGKARLIELEAPANSRRSR